ncbi:MAG: hypothetical protein M0C28_12740 [Candidatus Moduliflexus flocculans]|nr:hypothetical protein [Candidatus Moduliflexus flocculans]
MRTFLFMVPGREPGFRRPDLGPRDRRDRGGDAPHRHGPVDEAERRQAAAGLQLDRPDRLHRPGHGRRPLSGDDGDAGPAGPGRRRRRRRPLPRPQPRHLQGAALPHERQHPLRHRDEGPQQARRSHPPDARERRRRRDRLAVDLGHAALQRVLEQVDDHLELAPGRGRDVSRWSSSASSPCSRAP